MTYKKGKTMGTVKNKKKDQWLSGAGGGAGNEWSTGHF